MACSAVARAEGVRRGLRRREAQACCPALTVIDHDPAGAARAFEPVVAAIEAMAPGVEIVRPGIAAVATRGPARYFGGDDRLCDVVRATVTAAVGAAAVVGIADGPFAAELAARQATVIPPGATPTFLDPMPVSCLIDADQDPARVALVDLLRRLGIRTLGDLAVLPAASVVARFGPDGVLVHRLARGLDERPLAARTPPPDLVAITELDPPAERVETAAFAARGLAEELHRRVAALGLACTRIRIEAETEHGESLTRMWRHDGPLGTGAMAERVRWQLDGWITAGTTTAGITLLRLAADEVAPDDGRQLGFWGGEAVADQRAGRALARIQGLLGPEAVVTAVLGGGRGPGERVRLVPWGDPREPALPCAPMRSPIGPETPPWPGRVPAPAPATVHPAPPVAALVDAAGRTVSVTARGHLSADPTALSIEGHPAIEVTAWAGPWPADERWWDRAAFRRRARMQVVLIDGSAHLVALEQGTWRVEASYD
jgi:protein ImuB